MAVRMRWLALIVTIWLAFAVRIAGLDSQGLWYDEGYTSMLSRSSLARQWIDTARLDLNTPLHYNALHVWMIGAGTSEFAIRLLSVFAGVIAVALVVPLVRASRSEANGERAWRQRNWATSVIAAVLIAAWPVCVYLSREGRMYALLHALIVLSVLLLLRCLRFGRTPLWWLWAASAVAIYATHVLGAFAVAAQGLVIAVWWLANRRRAGWLPLAALGAATLIVAAWTTLLVALSANYGSTFTDRLDYGVMFLKSCLSIFVPHLSLDEAVSAPSFVAAMVILAGFLLSPSRGRLVIAISILSIAGITALACVTGKFTSRYPAIVAPLVVAGLATASGRGVALLWDARASVDGRPEKTRRWLARTAGVAWLAVTAAAVAACADGLVLNRDDPAGVHEDFRGAAALLRQKVKPDEVVLLESGHFAPVFEYYFGSLGWAALPDTPSLDIRNLMHYDNTASRLNRILDGKRGAWLLLWQDLLIDPTGIVQTLLIHQSGGADFDTRGFHGLRLLHYSFPQYTALPEQLPPMESQVEDSGARRGLSATGCQTFTPAYAGDATLEIACQWLLRPPPPRNILPFDVKVRLSLVDQASRELAAGEFLLAPINGMPARWDDRPITSLYNLPLPAELHPGRYELQASPSIDGAPVAPRLTGPVEIMAR